MPDDVIIQQCSPTLAGLKTGSLFTVKYDDEDEIRADLRRLNAILVPKGLRALPVRFTRGRALIYLYRTGHLARDLSHDDAKRQLCALGYPCEEPHQCVVTLLRKLREEGEFPHEVGLFLGYPPEDVEGFIRNQADNYQCVGCWKVYGDPEKAEKTFQKYRKCTNVYCRKWATGTPIERLTVAG